MHKRFRPLCEASDLTSENSAQFHRRSGKVDHVRGALYSYRMQESAF